VTKTVIRGITWDHARGYNPVVACAAAYTSSHTSIEITWDKRSLQAFAEQPVDQLAKEYDVIVLDHPWIGHAAATGSLIAIDDWAAAETLAAIQSHAVGRTYESYTVDGRQYALPIDAAVPVASWVPDNFARNGVSVPETWKELIDFARNGLVLMPCIPVEALMNFYMLCSTMSESAFSRDGLAINQNVALEALSLVRELTSLCDAKIFTMNPIRVYEVLASTSEPLYCPFGFGYVNYGLEGFRDRRLAFGDVVTLDSHGPLVPTLGGAGIGVSAFCKEPEVSTDFALFAASPDTQAGIYAQSGGQPAARTAWRDPDTNSATNGFFERTLPVIERAWLRPRYPGYLHFQDNAYLVVHRFLRDGGSPRRVMQELQTLLDESLERGKSS
jgi:multiple sugar transport system substrate-binding protein